MGEVIEQLVYKMKNLPLKKAYIVYMTITLVIASLIAFLILVVITDVRTYTDPNEYKIYKIYDIKKDEVVKIESTYGGSNFIVRNTKSGDSYTLGYNNMSRDLVQPLYNDNGEIIALEVLRTQSNFLYFLDLVLVAIYIGAFPVSYLIGCIYCSYIFFNNKLKKPIEILNSASHNISDNNLEFTVKYNNKDEMGDLCNTFEKMRGALLKSNKEMWEHMESRKRLNSAFAHDLRTPLTVLKGHTDMLINSNSKGKLDKDDLSDTLTTISKNIDRLERYTFEMSRMQKLEDIEIFKNKINLESLTNTIFESGEILTRKFKFKFDNRCKVNYIWGDFEIIMQSYENIIANATRYAKESISVECFIERGLFKINVIDDGEGLSRDALRKCTNPFYKEKENVNSQNFGLGLYICKVLTEKHGGYIEVRNNEYKGANITLAFDVSK